MSFCFCLLTLPFAMTWQKLPEWKWECLYLKETIGRQPQTQRTRTNFVFVFLSIIPGPPQSAQAGPEGGFWLPRCTQTPESPQWIRQWVPAKRASCAPEQTDLPCSPTSQPAEAGRPAVPGEANLLSLSGTQRTWTLCPTPTQWGPFKSGLPDLPPHYRGYFASPREGGEAKGRREGKRESRAGNAFTTF